MLQRIQTLYLLVSGLLITALGFFNLMEIVFNEELYTFKSLGLFKGVEMIEDGLPILLFTGLIVLLHLIIIFLFKKRILQMRLTVFTILLMLGLYGLYFYYTYPLLPTENILQFFTPNYPLAFPLIAIILDFLAIREIGKDEALVRSLDRIR